ncbi:hypothetical protein [Arthrobacter sp. 92]|uniref:hypothetical protein n=1 Tax=Arthrobacter sp. 92 TaxID=3418175 RepID=UPI003D08CAA1
MTTTEYVPFKITGVITAAVGSPVNDGMPGSALYPVPFAFSRALSDFEQKAIVAIWDNPPSYSNMHRSGIARCYSDKMVLARTTIEEVRDYHQRTLEAVVAKVNELSEAQHRSDAQAEVDEQVREATHHQKVKDIAKDLRF